MKTKVLIIGGGPAGLLLSLLLNKYGIDNVVLEKKSARHVASRIRAGILEPGTVKLLNRAGVGSRIKKEGLLHKGFYIAHGDKLHNISLEKYGKKSVTVYGQTEVTKDLMKKLEEIKSNIFYNVSNIKIHNIGRKTKADFLIEKNLINISCDFVVGCDGFHGITKNYIPRNIKKIFKKEFNFGWLGILSNTKPISNELIYINNKNGFALCSMRSETRSRYYLQCDIDDKVENWSDDRFWHNLNNALPSEIKNNLKTGKSIEKSIAKLRSYVIEPMKYKNLFLAGDAAHIVPPTGAKGLNLALSDVNILSQAFKEYYFMNSDIKLSNYSDNCLEKVWKTQRFSTWMTYLLHTYPKEDTFSKKLKQNELKNLFYSVEAKKILANKYLGNF